jgi:putative ABC transport system ATP-binding protein
VSPVDFLIRLDSRGRLSLRELLSCLKSVSISSTSAPIILRAENLGRTVNGKTLVESATFDLYGGEVLAIVGPSGSGKSSLLRLLNRLDEPTTGTVYLDGIDYREIKPQTLRQRVGFVSQRPFLFPGTVEGNLNFGPTQRGQILPPQAIPDLLTKVGLQGYGSRDVSNLSGGEAQRISVARTLANLPLILLLDEPTSALDEASKIGIESLLRDIVRDDRLTCVMVTHDKAQAGRLADRLLVVEKGRIVHSGATAEVLNA